MNLPEDLSAPSASGGNLIGESDQPSKIFPPLHLRKLLVPTDFSANSKKALIYAVRLAQRNNSSLILFHAFEPPGFVRQLPRDYSYEFHEETMKQCDTAMRWSAETLGMLAEAVKGSNIQIETSQRLGTPYEEIVKFRKRKGGGLNRNRHPWLYRPEPLLARQHSGTGRSLCALSSAGCTAGRAGLRFIKKMCLAPLPQRNCETKQPV
jgi:nucleotide-binding universal stress UspA family protein